MMIFEFLANPFNLVHDILEVLDDLQRFLNNILPVRFAGKDPGNRIPVATGSFRDEF